jgi:hypothetical protein
VSLRLFVSYRHADAEGYIGALAIAIKAEFGAEVELFVDVEDTGAGHDYVTVMLDAAGSCDAAVACVGPSWKGPVGGAPRIFNADDPVRVELRRAIAAGTPVYVGLLRGATQPRATTADIPEDLFPLAASTAFVLSHRNFAGDVAAMVRRIRREVPDRPGSADVASATLRITPPPGRYIASLEVFVDRRSVGRFHLNTAGLFRVPPGAHSLQVRAGWRRSNTLRLSAEAGSTVDIRFTPGGGGSTMQLAPDG